MWFVSQLDSPWFPLFNGSRHIPTHMNKAKPPRHPKSEDGHPLIGGQHVGMTVTHWFHLTWPACTYDNWPKITHEPYPDEVRRSRQKIAPCSFLNCLNCLIFQPATFIEGPAGPAPIFPCCPRCHWAVWMGWWTLPCLSCETCLNLPLENWHNETDKELVLVNMTIFLHFLISSLISNSKIFHDKSMLFHGISMMFPQFPHLFGTFPAGCPFGPRGGGNAQRRRGAVMQDHIFDGDFLRISWDLMSMLMLYFIAFKHRTWCFLLVDSTYSFSWGLDGKLVRVLWG